MIRFFAIIALAVVSTAKAQQGQYQFDIAAQPLSSALIEFASITKKNYIASGHLLRNKQSPPINGQMSAFDAITHLLQHSGLVLRELQDGTYLVIKPKKTKQAEQLKTAAIELPEPPEVILIRSTKRRDTPQNIPISANVIGVEMLEREGVKDVRQLTSVAQSMSYHGAITSAGQGMRIRGVGSGVIATGIEQSVGTAIDGVVTGPSGSGLQTLWDVEHIEILRGPQGTLFGKNVSAGAINNITKEPTDFVEAGISVEQEFAYRQSRIDAMASGPVSDGLNARLAVFGQRQTQGTIENIVRNEQENINKSYGIRVKLNLDKEDWWSKFSVSYSRTDDRCCGRVFSHIDYQNASGATNQWVIPALEQHDISVWSGNNLAISEAPLYETQRTLHSKFEWGTKFDSGHVLKTISGYRDWHHQTQNDGDNLNVDVVSYVADQRKLKLFTQEVQWLSPENDQWEYILGGYFYKQHFPSTEYIGGGADIAGYYGVTSVDSDIDVENFALFGHSTYYFEQNAAVFGGLRLLKESAEANAQQKGDNWIWPTDHDVNSVATKDTDYVATTGLQYWFENDNQIYLSASRGYKGKAIDNSSNSLLYRAPVTLDNGKVLTAADAILDPETVLSLELGSKNQFFSDGSLFNATVFFSRFTDFQAAAYDGNSNSFRLTNAGTVESKGIELEFKIRPWQDALLSVSSSWIDARFKHFTGAPCQVSQSRNNLCSGATGGQDLSGRKVNENPDWQHFISLQQDLYFGQDSLSLGLSYAWRDDVIYDTDLDPNTEQKAYGLLNLTAQYSFEQWQLTAFIYNATDENYANRIIDAPIWRGAYQRYPEKRRRYGVSLGYLY